MRTSATFSGCALLFNFQRTEELKKLFASTFKFNKHSQGQYSWQFLLILSFLWGKKYLDFKNFSAFVKPEEAKSFKTL